MRLCYIGGSTRTPQYNYNRLTATFDQMLIVGGFLLNEDGTLNGSQLMPLPPPPSNYLYPVFKAATTTRTPLAPVFSFVPTMGGAQINTALSTPSVAAATYAAIIQVMRAFSTFTSENAGSSTAEPIRATCGGVSLDFENDTHLWIQSYNTWVVGLRQALVAAGLPSFISNYISPRYDTSISTAVWQQAVTVTDMTILPAYIGTPPGPGATKEPGPRDPWPYVHDRIGNLVTRIGKSLLHKITYATPYYSDRNVCASSTPRSANLYQGVPGNWVQYRDCLAATAVAGAMVTDIPPYGCQCVVAPVSTSQYSAMVAAGQLPTGTQLPLWYQYYYNDLPTMRSRLTTLLSEGWINITLWCGGYEGDVSEYIDVFTVFPSNKAYADGFAGAISARLGYPFVADADGVSAVSWVLTPTMLTCFNSIKHQPEGNDAATWTYGPVLQIPLVGCREIAAAPTAIVGAGVGGDGVVFALRSDGKILKLSRYGLTLATYTVKTATGATVNVEHIDVDAANDASTQLYVSSGLKMYRVDVSGTGPTAPTVDSFNISSCVKIARFQVYGDRMCIIDAGENNYPKIMVRLGTHTFMTALVKTSVFDAAIDASMFYLMCTDGSSSSVRMFTLDTATQVSATLMIPNGRMIDVRDGIRMIVTTQGMAISELTN